MNSVYLVRTSVFVTGFRKSWKFSSSPSFAFAIKWSNSNILHCTKSGCPLSALDRQFSEALALADLGRFTRPYAWCGNGARPHARVWLLQAFLAKSIYQFPTTAALIEALRRRPTLRRLCGWDRAGDIPSEPTFSRAFAAFAAHALPQQIHAQMVTTHAGPKLVGHLSRDATAIAVPERPGPKPVPAKAPRRPHGRPKKGQTHPPPPPKRLDLQATRTVAENLAELPCICAIGVKRNSQGFQSCWVGYKLHLGHRRRRSAGECGAHQRQRARQPGGHPPRPTQRPTRHLAL